MKTIVRWSAPELRKLDIAGETRLGLSTGGDMIIIGTAS